MKNGKKRRQLVKGCFTPTETHKGHKFYGENCENPDMLEEKFLKAKTEFLEALQKKKKKKFLQENSKIFMIGEKD